MSVDPYDFGAIWRHYADAVADPQRHRARRDLEASVPPPGLVGRDLLDLGCGAGLQGWAALEAGARRVVSVDVDAGCVAAAEILRVRSGVEASRWRIERGSALDPDFMAALGEFDVVLALGAPAHSGDWSGFLRQAARRVGPGGCLLCSMAEATPPVRDRILRKKQAFRDATPLARKLRRRLAIARRQWGQLRRGKPIHGWQYTKERGSSVYHDLLVQLAALPWQVASVDEVNRVARGEGLFLEDLCLRGETFPNELLFRRPEERT